MGLWRRCVVVGCVVAGLLGGAGRAWALAPDELLLLVNPLNPDGRTLAEEYAAARGVPAGRICEIPTVVGDEMPFGQYEKVVKPAVRKFLLDHHLEAKVKCIVTFYGFPLRIGQRPAGSAEEKKEYETIEAELKRVRAEAEGAVVDLEKLAKEVDPTLEPRITGAGGEDARVRGDAALLAVERGLVKVGDAKKRDEYFRRMIDLVGRLAGPNTAGMLVARNQLANPNLDPAKRADWERMVAFVERSREEFKGLMERREDAAARDKAREMAKKGWGLLQYGSLLVEQRELLKPGETISALDSELALLWWDGYARGGWQMNALNYRYPLSVHHPPVMITSRLDGPSVAVVRRMIHDGIEVEKTGLKGKVVIDSQGSPGPTGYGVMDRMMENLAHLLRDHAKGTEVVFDEKKAVLPENSVDNVALYVGWYSVEHYIHSVKLVPGAVGCHVASWEARFMREPAGRTLWVPNLLKDGAAAAVGPVWEPYLGAFPNPAEFYPVLMTGRLTLAESYWRTTPMTSWQMILVGDPLYNPYKAGPALAVDDLPGALKTAVEWPAQDMPTTRPLATTTTAPATRP